MENLILWKRTADDRREQEAQSETSGSWWCCGRERVNETAQQRGGWSGGAKSAESRPPRSICILSAHGPMRSGGKAARAADWLAAGGGEGQRGRGGAGGEGAANGARRRASEERPNRRACARMRFTDEEMHAHGPRAFAALPGPLQRREGDAANQTAPLGGGDARSGERRCDKMEE